MFTNEQIKQKQNENNWYKKTNCYNFLLAGAQRAKDSLRSALLRSDQGHCAPEREAQNRSAGAQLC